MLNNVIRIGRYRIVINSTLKKLKLLDRFQQVVISCNVPKSSELLKRELEQRGYPHWTAWYVPYCDVEDDLWGKSHFNFEVEKGINYHVLRTGAFPFIKFHCSKRPWEALRVENTFYSALKIINLGIPTFLYGVAGLLWAKHTETVEMCNGHKVTIYFWYAESKFSKH
jgi:hypothetical protein